MEARTRIQMFISAVLVVGLVATSSPTLAAAVWTNVEVTKRMRVINMVVTQDIGVVRVQVDQTYAMDASQTCTNPNHVDVVIKPDVIPADSPDDMLLQQRDIERYQQIVSSLRNALLGYRQVDFLVLQGECSTERTSDPIPIAIGIRIHG